MAWHWVEPRRGAAPLGDRVRLVSWGTGTLVRVIPSNYLTTDIHFVCRRCRFDGWTPAEACERYVGSTEVPATVLQSPNHRQTITVSDDFHDVARHTRRSLSR